jgi:hypothetical protein
MYFQQEALPDDDPFKAFLVAEKRIRENGIVRPCAIADFQLLPQFELYSFHPGAIGKQINNRRYYVFDRKVRFIEIGFYEIHYRFNLFQWKKIDCDTVKVFPLAVVIPIDE